MKYTMSLICLAIILACAECASIGVGTDLERRQITFGLLKNVLFVDDSLNVFPPLQSTTGRGPTAMLDTLRNIIEIPDPTSLVPRLPLFAHESSSKSIPEILGIYNEPGSYRIPGLTAALQLARNRLQVALKIKGDLNSGIKQAVVEALRSKNPLEAIRTIIATVLKTYTTVAANCPFLVVARRVLQEGIRLAEEIAQSVGNVYFGTTTAAAATDFPEEDITVATDTADMDNTTEIEYDDGTTQE